MARAAALSSLLADESGVMRSALESVCAAAPRVTGASASKEAPPNVGTGQPSDTAASTYCCIHTGAAVALVSAETVVSTGSMPAVSMQSDRNSPQETVSSGSKRYCPHTHRPVKSPSSARTHAAYSQERPAVSA